MFPVGYDFTVFEIYTIFMHPFFCLLIQQWYQWRDHWQNEQAEEWMHENGVDLGGGRIVTNGKNTFVWS